MKEPDVSNIAQQSQEKASAADIKRARLEFDQAKPTVGTNGCESIRADEGTTPGQKDFGADTAPSGSKGETKRIKANDNTKHAARGGQD